jgi:hypothetical protein
VAIYLNAAHTLLACGVRIEPENNNNLSHVIYHNVAGSPDKITVTATTEGIKYENEQTSCPGGKVTKEDGVLVSHVTLESKNLEDDVWMSD